MEIGNGICRLIVGNMNQAPGHTGSLDRLESGEQAFITIK